MGEIELFFVKDYRFLQCLFQACLSRLFRPRPFKGDGDIIFVFCEGR